MRPRNFLVVVALAAPGAAQQSRASELADRMAEAELHRGRGDPVLVRAALRRAFRVAPTNPLVQYALGEVYASDGRTLDARLARRYLRAFLASADRVDLARLQAYRGDGNSLRAVCDAVRTWIVKLEAGEVVMPPPVLDRKTFLRRRGKLRKKEKLLNAQIATREARIRRLRGQMATVGDLRRKDGYRNRQQIRQDLRRNEREIERFHGDLREVQRQLGTYARLLSDREEP